MNTLKKAVYEKVLPCMGKVFAFKNQYINVIYYHDIVQGSGHSFMQTNIDIFKSHMQYLVDNHFETMRFDDLDKEENFKHKKKRVLIAFDDGWRSNYCEIFEYMKSLGLKYNIFLAVGLIGENPDYLTWDMVKEMHESGLCGFGTHTFNHVDFSYETTNFKTEIYKADAILEQHTGIIAKDFCYPYGKYSEASNVLLLSQSNYKRIYTSDLLYSYPRSDKFIMGRCGISNDESFNVFKGKVKGYYNILSMLKNHGK